MGWLDGQRTQPPRRWAGHSSPRRSGPYLPGRPGWVKVKNRDYWRYEVEREGAFKARRERQFV